MCLVWGCVRVSLCVFLVVYVGVTGIETYCEYKCAHLLARVHLSLFIGVTVCVRLCVAVWGVSRIQTMYVCVVCVWVCVCVCVCIQNDSYHRLKATLIQRLRKYLVDLNRSAFGLARWWEVCVYVCVCVCELLYVCVYVYVCVEGEWVCCV